LNAKEKLNSEIDTGELLESAERKISQPQIAFSAKKKIIEAFSVFAEEKIGPV